VMERQTRSQHGRQISSSLSNYLYNAETDVPNFFDKVHRGTKYN
jgi:hypothetical protein